MKRAPIIPKNTVTSTPISASETPAAPMVDSLIARVSAMAKGSMITLPVCGRDVRFTLETICADIVETSTTVWGGNERDQTLLTEEALDDLIPSFLLSGQQTPAFGRKVAGVIEVADGSRRRKTAILTSSNYRVLVGDLDDEQMNSLCKIGNDYRPTSAYERGKRYKQRLEKEFNGNITSLADAENISRKVITRCINTSKLPREIIALFPHPGELSARAGDALAKLFIDHETLILDQTENMSRRKAEGEILEAEDIIGQINEAINKPNRTNRAQIAKREYTPGATSQYKGSKFILSLDTSRLPGDVVEKIEAILMSLNTFTK